jgi:hypothetical protein
VYTSTNFVQENIVIYTTFSIVRLQAIPGIKLFVERDSGLKFAEMRLIVALSFTLIPALLGNAMDVVSDAATVHER